MIRKKELLKRIEILETHSEKQYETIKFLLAHNKDEVEFYSQTNFLCDWKCVVRYIYNQELCAVFLKDMLSEFITVIENTKDSVLFKYERNIKPQYFMIDKRNKTYVEVSVLQNKIDNIKATENIKETTKAFSNAIDGLVSALKQKTQKKAKPSEKTKAKCECDKKSCKKGGK